MAAAELTLPCGLGLGWRVETGPLCAARRDLVCFEVIAETLPRAGEPPPALAQLVDAGRTVIPHGVGLGLGSGQRPAPERVARLARAATMLRAPLVSEHLAWVRAGGVETEHLLPVPRTRGALALIVDHIREVQDALPCPLVLENIAALFRWQDDAIAEADFLAELVARTGVALLIDVANLHANLANGFSCIQSSGQTHRPIEPQLLVEAAQGWIRRLPAHAIAYLHIAGGFESGGFRHDTHAHPVADPTLAMTTAILDLIGPRPVVLERDDHFGNRASLEAELDSLAAVIPTGSHRCHFAPPRASPADVPFGYSDELTKRQAALVNATLHDGPSPEGFDVATMHRLRAKLRAKLVWVAARREAARVVHGPKWLRRLWPGR